MDNLPQSHPASLGQQFTTGILHKWACYFQVGFLFAVPEFLIRSNSKNFVLWNASMNKLLSPAFNPSFPVDFVPLAGSIKDCEDCGQAESVGFQFDYAYQPIVDIAQKKVFAHEALIRGPHGESASSVLSQVTEQNRYRFDQACRVKAIKGAKALGIQECISINFLPNAIYKPELCIRTTLAAAQANSFALDHIIFEVTEGERVEDGPWFAEILREYKRCGFKTAIDDFGAGYAGMKLLADFQPDIIKIDMDLIRGIQQSPARKSIVRALVKLCEEMKIIVVAEGVESSGEREFLRDAGISLMQGYLFAKPAFHAVAQIDTAALGE